MAKEKKTETYERTDGKEHADFLLNQLHYEGKLFASRVNMLLVAESLLFISYFYIRCSETCNNNIISLIVAIIAIYITRKYLDVMERHSDNIKKLDDEVRYFDKDYRYIAKGRGAGFSANKVLGIHVTWAFLIGWIVFFAIDLAYMINQHFCQLYSILC